MKKIAVVFLAVILQTTFGKEAVSATAICAGKVIQVANHAPGGLYVRLNNSNLMKACSLDQLSFRTTPESCKSIMAMAMMAKATDKSVTFYIDNAPGTDCTTIPQWYDADMRFFVVEP